MCCGTDKPWSLVRIFEEQFPIAFQLSSPLFKKLLATKFTSIFLLSSEEGKHNSLLHLSPQFEVDLIFFGLPHRKALIKFGPRQWYWQEGWHILPRPFKCNVALWGCSLSSRVSRSLKRHHSPFLPCFKLSKNEFNLISKWFFYIFHNGLDLCLRFLAIKWPPQRLQLGILYWHQISFQFLGRGCEASLCIHKQHKIWIHGTSIQINSIQPHTNQLFTLDRQSWC